MCGIAGVLIRNPDRTEGAFREMLQAMTDSLTHRGPDSAGYWLDMAAGIGLGHRRLAVIDLTEQGAQPMISASGRYVITFNGEIYNFQVIRQEFDMPFRGNSDTEVMLAAFEKWGIAAAVKRFIGMFAFAVWDKQERELHLCRDRMGEKPLYYGWVDNAFVFASELKALRRYPAWQGEINRDSLAYFLRYNYIPAPHSIYQGIFKLEPGKIFTLSGHQSQITSYWSLDDVFSHAAQNPLTYNDQDASEVFEHLLKDAIQLQMIADVPLGAFLSGGVDSSVVVALMQTLSSRPVKTFSIGFTMQEFNETPYARAVAHHLGTEHTEYTITEKEALDIIPSLPQIYDEPFSDASQIPTILVSQIARRHVTVSLSGDGGDELFIGYARYFDALQAYRQLHRFPVAIQRFFRQILRTVPIPLWRKTFALLSKTGILPDYLTGHDTVDKLQRLPPMLPITSSEKFYRDVMTHWPDSEHIVQGAQYQQHRHSYPVFPESARPDDLLQAMSQRDMLTYLPDDILVKVDRAGMSASLESRIPLLDYRVVEFACRLPFHMKVRGNTTKWLLRQILYKYVPRELIERPKMGFGVPLAHWLRHDLRDRAEALLNPRRLREDGFFNPEIIHQYWNEHLSGIKNWHYHLWDVLMFLEWNS